VIEQTNLFQKFGKTLARKCGFFKASKNLNLNQENLII